MQQEILTKNWRRRRWPVEEKLRILAEVEEDGASVADVARRHDITRQHIYQWRQEMRRKGMLLDEDAATFLAVQVTEDLSASASVRHDGRVEIGLRNGRILLVPGDTPDSLVTRMIRVAEAA